MKWLSLLMLTLSLLLPTVVGCLPAKLTAGQILGDRSDGSDIGDTSQVIDSDDGDQVDRDVVGSDSAGDVDETPPTTTITQQPAPVTGKTAASFEFECDESVCSFSCKLDNGDWEPCESGKTYTGLGDGGHTFSVQAKDGAMNEEVAPKSYTWTIDSTLLETTLTKKPTVVSNVSSPTFEFVCNKAPCTFECRLDNGVWESCSSGKSYSNLVDGAHTFEVRATDGNSVVESSPESWGWTIDTRAPEVSLTKTPAAVTSDTGTGFEFECDESGCSFECKLNDGDWGPCSSPYSGGTVAAGFHQFSVRATDAAGNLDPSKTLVFNWEVDQTPPTTSFNSAPGKFTFNEDVTFEFDCDDAPCTFECKLDDGEWESCSSPYMASLIVAPHTLQVRSTDAVGNVETVPVEYVFNVLGWKALGLGTNHSCGVASNSTLWCWGSNEKGQLGIGVGTSGTGAKTTVPTLVGTDEDWTTVYGGPDHTCGVKSDKSLWCWGDNTSGQIGTGSSGGVVEEPKQVGSDTDWFQVSLGGAHTCATKTDRSLWCWGYNVWGQLGIGSIQSEPNPMPVNAVLDVTSEIEKDWTKVALGNHFSCATKTGGSLWCWGNGTLGEMGNDMSVAGNKNPVEVVGVDSWVNVGASLNGTVVCGIQSATNGDRSLWCWGWGNKGLGPTAGNSHPVPTKVEMQPTDLGGVLAGRSHMCVTTTFPPVRWCWGSNEFGQLGNGEVDTVVYEPTSFGVLKVYHKLALGGNHTCLMEDHGRLQCWGSNTYGQIGNGKSGAEEMEPSPVLIK